MCGITAVFDHSPDNAPSTIRAMTEALAHRGPDDAGTWNSGDGRVALGHRRLSIIDLSALGRNPMSWRGGRFRITYNGEVYNYRTLRRELEAEGYAFTSQTDTEVILAAYERWGIECLGRFIGMFAFALWDEARRQLVIVRDRLGKKPLYYADYPNRVAIASELKALITDPRFPRTVDREAVRQYLRYGYIPAPRTIYTAARKLLPGHYAVVSDGRIEVHRYWDPLNAAARGCTEPPEQLEEQVESLLSDAVGLRMIADVPLGAFLSGGVDSSLIVALMQEQSARPVRTFSIRFANQRFNEAAHAAQVARHLGTDHHEQSCDEAALLAVVDRLPEMFDEPFADSSAVPTFVVSRMARQHVTVALSGDGGDESFFGYPRYRYHDVAAPVLKLPGPVRRAVAFASERMSSRRLHRVANVLRSDDDDQYARFISWCTQEEIAAVTGRESEDALLYSDMLNRSVQVPRPLRPTLLDLVSYLPEDILTKVDRASMATSLEVRAPLLDHRIVELALALPMSMKYRSGEMKRVLRRLLFKRVPRSLVDRPKQGFGVPLLDWFRGPLRERMDVYVAGDDLEELGVDPRPCRAAWAAFKTGRTHRADYLWQMFALVAWSRRFAPTCVAGH
jgi:asparagine synthase (glutamine-hydrolysing)